MGPLNEKIVVFHPMVNQQVEEVRQGIELKSSETANIFPWTFGVMPQRIAGTINETACPEYI